MVNPVVSLPAMNVSNTPAHADHRGGAITACDSWRTVLHSAMRQSRPNQLFNLRGLAKRTALLALVEEARERTCKARTQQGPDTPAAGTYAQAHPHPDDHAALMASFDWIALTVAKGPRTRAKRSLRMLDRFAWGYLERTRAYERFFMCRRIGLEPALREPAHYQPEICRVLIGCAYGAPTLAAWAAGTGRTRGGRRSPKRSSKRSTALFIADKAYAVLAANKEAKQLLSMQERFVRLGTPNLGPELAQEFQACVARWSAANSPAGRPVFAVQRGETPRLLLHMNWGHFSTGAREWMTDPNAWNTVPHATLFDRATRATYRDFRSRTYSEWGSCDALEWFLSVASPVARRHSVLLGGAFPDPCLADGSADLQ